MHFLPGFGPHPPHEPAPRSRRHHALWAAVGAGAGALVLGGLVGALLLGKQASDSVPHPRSSAHTVRYEVDGGSAHLTYRAAAGTQRAGAVQLPWSKEITLPAAGPASVVARDRGSGYVACRIYLDGTLRASREASGPAAAVTCSVG
jgi:hypothetical protein